METYVATLDQRVNHIRLKMGEDLQVEIDSYTIDTRTDNTYTCWVGMLSSAGKSQQSVLPG